MSNVREYRREPPRSDRERNPERRSCSGERNRRRESLEEEKERERREKNGHNTRERNDDHRRERHRLEERNDGDKKKHRNERVERKRKNDEPDRPPKKIKKEPVWGNSNEKEKEDNVVEKEQPTFEKSGKLTEHTNMYNGVVIKYNEPPEARKPKRRWRLYPYKGDEAMPILHMHRQSAFLIGRDRRVADIPMDHPSISHQHAVFQFRSVNYARKDGTTGKRVWPYIIDLESGNGTYINNDKIESRRYVELKERDVLKFGYSSRDYVLLHDSSDTSVLDVDEDLVD